MLELQDGEKLTDAGIKELAALPRLQELRVHGGKFSAPGLKELKGLQIIRLRFVSGPAGWMGLGQLKQLQTFTLYGVQQKPADLQMLAEVASLQSLSVEVEATDADLAPLQKLTQLKKLSLGGNGFTGSGLKGLANLKDLRLYGSAVTDAGLKEALSTLPALEKLSIGGMKLTGACLEALGTLPKLQVLRVNSQRAFQQDSWKKLDTSR
jgi:hypothetical protein